MEKQYYVAYVSIPVPPPPLEFPLTIGEPLYTPRETVEFFATSEVDFEIEWEFPEAEDTLTALRRKLTEMGLLMAPLEEE